MEIKTIEETWLDKARDREVPVKIYLPENKKPPLIVFSHGLGGSRESYKYIGEYFARHGFAVMLPTHIGIDDGLLKGERPFQNLKLAADDKENLTNLPEDITFILDCAEFKGLDFDYSKIAMAGHSFGSYTTLAVSGQSMTRDGTEINFEDDRIVCAVAISPLAAKKNPAEAYENIMIPVLHITGVKDDSPFGLLDPVERRIPYDNMNESDQYLVIFNEADHMVFAAQRRQNKFSEADVKVMELTCEVMHEFFKKYLLEANSSLDSAAFSAKLGAHAKFEKKLQ